MDNEGYVFVDTETGGTDPTICALTQVAAIITDPAFKPVSYFAQYIRPAVGLELSQAALDITGFDPEWLNVWGRHEWDVLNMFCQWLEPWRGSLRFAGFYCKFDLAVLDQWYLRGASAMGENGIKLPEYKLPAFDVHQEAKKTIWMPSYKLIDVCRYWGINTSKAHNALADIGNTVKCAAKLRERQNEKAAAANAANPADASVSQS